ncbi:MAG: right-handed parallel beta-helix repeat-containing protein [Gallionella sp.]|nr:right-handed parallel beta-helix repeat-containing protein [Gallionella sp.]
MARFTYIPNRVIDSNGISDGANIYFYQVGTTTPVSIFSDAALTTPASNPYPVAVGAIVPALYYAETDIRVKIIDDGGNTVSDDDPYERPITQTELISTATAKGAGLVGFSHAATYAVSTVGAKLKAIVSITDAPYNAVAGDTGDQTSAIQAAVDAVNTAGGGTVIIPPGTYRIITAIVLYSNITVLKYGTIHMVNTTTLNAFQAVGTAGAILSNIHILGGKITGDATFAAGVPSVTNGSAINFQFVSDSTVVGVKITGFADNGTAFANGDNNLVLGCNVDQCGQNIAFYASTRDTYDNKAIGNTITACGKFNALHSEGNASGGTKKNYGIVFANNVIDDPYGLGINVENSPEAVVSGNRVRDAGPGTAANLIHGIILFGSPNSSVTGNVSTSNDGYGIVIGAGSSETAVSGNSTLGNTVGSIIVTDGNGTTTGVAATNNIAMGINSLAEGDVAVAGNYSFLNRTKNFKFSNVAVSDASTLDWYEEGSFTPVAQGVSAAGAGTYTLQIGRFTRIGNTVHFSANLGWSAHTGTGDLQVSGLPYAASANVVQPVTCWGNALAVPAGQILQATIPASGSLVNIQTYADTTGVAAALAIDTVVDAFYISGVYRV